MAGSWQEWSERWTFVSFACAYTPAEAAAHFGSCRVRSPRDILEYSGAFACLLTAKWGRDLANAPSACCSFAGSSAEIAANLRPSRWPLSCHRPTPMPTRKLLDCVLVETHPELRPASLSRFHGAATRLTSGRSSTWQDVLLLERGRYPTRYRSPCLCLRRPSSEVKSMWCSPPPRARGAQVQNQTQSIPDANARHVQVRHEELCRSRSHTIGIAARAEGFASFRQRWSRRVPQNWSAPGARSFRSKRNT